jgi:hypothetical protein
VQPFSAVIRTNMAILRDLPKPLHNSPMIRMLQEGSTDDIAAIKTLLCLRIRDGFGRHSDVYLGSSSLLRYCKAVSGKLRIRDCAQYTAVRALPTSAISSIRTPAACGTDVYKQGVRSAIIVYDTPGTRWIRA